MLLCPHHVLFAIPVSLTLPQFGAVMGDLRCAHQSHDPSSPCPGGQVASLQLRCPWLPPVGVAGERLHCRHPDSGLRFEPSPRQPPHPGFRCWCMRAGPENSQRESTRLAETSSPAPNPRAIPGEPSPLLPQVPHHCPLPYPWLLQANRPGADPAQNTGSAGSVG